MAGTRVRWQRTYDKLGPGVVMRHHAMVAGWHLIAELFVDGTGTLHIRCNGVVLGGPMLGCTLAGGRKRYLASLKQLGRPTQLRLPV